MRIDGELVQASSVVPVKSSGRAKRVLIIGGSTTLFAALLIFMLWTRDTQEDPPRLVSSIWTALVEGTPRLHFIMEERREREGSFDTDGLHSYSLPYSIFTLHALNGRDGTAPAVTTITRTDGGVVDRKKYEVQLHLIEKPEILGPQGDILWLWNYNGLEARKLSTLELVWTTSKLKELNPELGELLPTDIKYYKVLGTINALTYKGSDARYFQIDPRSGKIQVVDNAVLARLSKEHTKTADTAFSSLRPDSAAHWSTSVSGLMWESLIDEATHMWYGLLASDQRVPDRWRNPKYDFSGPSGEVARSLYQTRFSSEQSRTTTELFINLDVAGVKKLGDERFLMGGFLRRPNTYSVWIVGDSKKDARGASARQASTGGKAFLVLHRNALGDDKPWFITRLGTDGKVHWTRSTGLPDLQYLCDGHGAVVFTGYSDRSQPTGKRPNMMVFIDEATGQCRTLNLMTGEMSNNAS